MGWKSKCKTCIPIIPGALGAETTLCRKWLNSQGHITIINLSNNEKCIQGKNVQVTIPFCMSRKFPANFIGLALS